MSAFDDILRNGVGSRPSVPTATQQPTVPPEIAPNTVPLSTPTYTSAATSAFDALLKKGSPQGTPKQVVHSPVTASSAHQAANTPAVNQSPSQSPPIPLTANSGDTGKFWGSMIIMALLTVAGTFAILYWPNTSWLKWIVLPIMAIYNLSLPFQPKGYWHRLGLIAFAATNFYFIYSQVLMSSPIPPARHLSQIRSTVAGVLPTIRINDATIRSTRAIKLPMFKDKDAVVQEVEFRITALKATDIPSAGGKRTRHFDEGQTGTIQSRSTAVKFGSDWRIIVTLIEPDNED